MNICVIKVPSCWLNENKDFPILNTVNEEKVFQKQNEAGELQEILKGKG